VWFVLINILIFTKIVAEGGVILLGLRFRLI